MSKTTWDSIYTIAEKFGSKFPDVVSAQWSLESGFGKFTSGVNNFFGIKGEGTKKTTKEWDGEKFIEIIDEFKDFDSPELCVKELVEKWYKDYKGYSGVNRAKSRNEAARLLMKESYATDPEYAEKLIKLMDEYSKDHPDPVVAANRPIKLLEAAKHYKGEVHQDSAWLLLDGLLTDAQRQVFTTAYRRPQKPSRRGYQVFSRNPLNVDYFWQRDSTTGHGERSCQSSAVAMAVDYINPNLIEDDDDYLRLVFRFGDTVSQSAHKSALESLGMQNEFKMNGSEDDIVNLIDRGYPVPIGILHRGYIHSPNGGGHWVTIIGYTKKDFLVNDPFGKLDIISGGYSNAEYGSGNRVAYPRDMLMKRWLISSNTDGWYWDLSGNKIH
jgi:hypothetical protein